MQKRGAEKAGGEVRVRGLRFRVETVGAGFATDLESQVAETWGLFGSKHSRCFQRSFEWHGMLRNRAANRHQGVWKEIGNK